MEKFQKSRNFPAETPLLMISTMHFLKIPALLMALLATTAFANPKILLIAGPKSHAPGAHEHPAGCELLAKHLNTCGLPLDVEVSQGWPADPAKVENADTLVIYSDGLDGHAAAGHIPALRKRYDAGKGLVLLHFALEPKNEPMGKFFEQAIGGYFEVDWSVNPIWMMTRPILGDHPATLGVNAFEMEEEFYYHIRLRDEIIPLLQAHPPESSLGNDGPRSGNPAVRKALADKIPQTLAWAVENPNKSRGFGFTGGHFHHHWSQPDFRKIVLNAIVWTAQAEVPSGGITGKVAAAPAYQTIDIAIAKGDLDDVKLHIAANPESLHKGGREKSRPPLEQAVLRKKTEIALYLIQAGADPNTVNASKRTPLHLAVDRNNPTIAAALLKAGAKPDLRDKSGWTPLHHAAAKNQLKTAKAILDGGANPMTLSELGGTPLHEAAVSGGKEIILLFLKYKVDPSVKSKQNVTALDIAKEYKNQEAIDVLEGL